MSATFFNLRRRQAAAKARAAKAAVSETKAPEKPPKKGKVKADGV